MAAMDDLPDEILALFMRFLPCVVVRCRASQVCVRWRAIALDKRAVGRRSCAIADGRGGRLSQCDHAARAGHVDCLVHARGAGARWGESTCEAAAAAGHLHVLVYAHEAGCPWDRHACSAAAGAGALDCLRYLHENGCPWSEDTCIEAARFGRLDCLAYACAHRCPTTAFAGTIALRYGHLNCVAFAHERGWLDERACAHATYADSVACLAWVHEHGFPLDSAACLDAAYAVSIDCMAYIVDHGGALHKDALRAAIRQNSLEMVHYMVDRRFPRDDNACMEEAAAHASRPIVSLLIDAGVGVTARALTEAAVSDNLEAITEIHQRALDGGGDGVCQAAASAGSARVLAFAVECGWPWGGPPTCEAAIEGRNLTIVQLARDHGCRCKAWVKKFAPRRRRRLVARNAPNRRPSCGDLPH
nr:ankyrin repeat [Pandoravirus massiliensis]